MLMARAAQMVWTWSPCSGATPGESSNSKSWAPTGALAASSSDSRAVATNGVPVGAGPAAGAVSTAEFGAGTDADAQHGASLPWA